jgi:hypothetical protein
MAGLRAVLACIALTMARVPGALNRGISRADEEKNTNAQTKNVLESIESELRRQRIGQ